MDTAARLVQPILEKELGTNVEVINKPGAGGQIGYTALTSAKPDGYTIGATGSPSVVVSPLDPARGAKYTRASFQPLGRQVIDPAVIAVQPDSPYKTLKELLDAAKANPKSMTASTTGLQTGEHFALAQIQETTGSEFAPVHFSEGASQATTAFLGKHVDVLVANVSDVTDLTKQGKARVLGIMTAERSPSLPDVPTFKESGYEVEAGTVRGYSAPAGLPDAVAKKLEAALAKGHRGSCRQGKDERPGPADQLPLRHRLREVLGRTGRGLQEGPPAGPEKGLKSDSPPAATHGRIHHDNSRP